MSLRPLDQLETVWLHHTNVSDAGLVHLEGLRSLQQVELMETLVTDAGVARLQQRLPHARILR
jgi:hypothetical protein